METNEIFEELQGILADHLGVEDTDVTMEANIVEDLGADSLDIVEIIMEVEDHFDIEVDDEDVERIKVVSQLVDYIAKKI